MKKKDTKNACLNCYFKDKCSLYNKTKFCDNCKYLDTCIETYLCCKSGHRIACEDLTEINPKK